MTLTAYDVPSSVAAAHLAMKRFGRLAADYRSGWARLAFLPCPLFHQLDVVDRLEQAPPRQPVEPSVNLALMAEMHGQLHQPHRAHEIANGIDHFLEFDLTRPPAAASFGIKGAIRSHSSSVRSEGYRLAFRPISAIRPGRLLVHIKKRESYSRSDGNPGQSDFFKSALR